MSMGRKIPPTNLKDLHKEWRKFMMQFRWEHPELHNMPFKDPEAEKEFRELYPVE